MPCWWTPRRTAKDSLSTSNPSQNWRSPLTRLHFPTRHLRLGPSLPHAIRWNRVCSRDLLAQSRRLRPRPAASVAECPADGSWSEEAAHAEANRQPATFRLCLIPPCFPGCHARGGEAEEDSEGLFSASDLLEENWSGRRDSNPRPRPWQGSSGPAPLVQKRIVTPRPPQTILP